jgi:hypothetical protein
MHEMQIVATKMSGVSLTLSCLADIFTVCPSDPVLSM